MQTKTWYSRAAILLTATSLAGCGLHKESFTYKLWQTDEFRHWREPATNAAVTVHYAPTRKDYLVTYNSLRDGDNKPRRQSYFLGVYETSDLDHRQPRRVSTNHLQLLPVPLNGPTNSPPSATFDRLLIIHTAEGQIGPYALPTYKESDGVALKTALTPLTVAGDVTCLSLLVGFFAVLAWAHTGAYIPPD